MAVPYEQRDRAAITLRIHQRPPQVSGLGYRSRRAFGTIADDDEARYENEIASDECGMTWTGRPIECTLNEARAPLPIRAEGRGVGLRREM